jgi:hypothetical protein
MMYPGVLKTPNFLIEKIKLSFPFRFRMKINDREEFRYPGTYTVRLKVVTNFDAGILRQ